MERGAAVVELTRATAQDAALYVALIESFAIAPSAAAPKKPMAL